MYPQLLLPIEEGISKTQEYKDVCLKGEQCNRQLNFSFNPNDSLEKIKTVAGEIDVLTLYDRQDFEHACVCLSNRCEPKQIPLSTGAMFISGLNNWNKVRNNIENYKDSIIVLSCGNYSNVTNDDVLEVTGGQVSLTSKQWLEKSIIIRKYHEITHFVMRKLYPNDINFIRDELIADMVGLLKAFNRFDPRLLRLFLGIENEAYRKGGRLENYEGGSIDNIPSINKMIDKLEERFLYFVDAEEVLNNIKEFILN